MDNTYAKFNVDNATNPLVHAKTALMRIPITNIVILSVLGLIITFMLMNTWFNNSVLQWFIWIFLFAYLAFFVTIKFYLVENLDPWASALIVSLFVFLFPSPLFNTRKNKNSTKYLSIFYAMILLLSSYLMISGYTSSYFEATDSNSTWKIILLNYIVPLSILTFPAFSYWGAFY